MGSAGFLAGLSTWFRKGTIRSRRCHGRCRFGRDRCGRRPHQHRQGPYAQAAAAVGTNGVNIQRTNTVAATSRTETNRYCVELTSAVDASKAVPVATLSNSAGWGSEVRVSRNHPACPANSIRVTTGTNGAPADQPFYLVIP